VVKVGLKGQQICEQDLAMSKEKFKINVRSFVFSLSREEREFMCGEREFICIESTGGTAMT
jgi:hypothetical protein